MSRLTTDQRANLVAYLDGELEEADAQAIENALAQNEVARREVDLLARTWQLLDELPRPKVSDDFTRKTLTRIQVPPESALPQVSLGDWRPAMQRILWVALAIAGLGASATLGFVATNQWMPDESRLLIDELPVVERLEIYKEVGSIEFVKELQRSGLFQEDRR